MSTQKPAVRPRVLLWTLLACHVGLTISFLVLAANVSLDAAAVIKARPEADAKVLKAKEKLQSETDIEKLRSYSLKAITRTLHDGNELSARLHQMTEMLLWAAILPGVSAAVLAYIIYALRSKIQPT